MEIQVLLHLVSKFYSQHRILSDCIFHKIVDSVLKFSFVKKQMNILSIVGTYTN